MFDLPLEYALIGFEHPTFSGKIAPELQDLAERGIVRIVDIVFIQKDEHGEVRTIELNDLEPETYELFVPIGEHVSSLFTTDDLEIAASKLPNGSAASSSSGRTCGSPTSAKPSWMRAASWWSARRSRLRSSSSSSRRSPASKNNRRQHHEKRTESPRPSRRCRQRKSPRTRWGHWPRAEPSRTGRRHRPRAESPWTGWRHRPRAEPSRTGRRYRPAQWRRTAALESADNVAARHSADRCAAKSSATAPPGGDV